MTGIVEGHHQNYFANVRARGDRKELGDRSGEDRGGDQPLPATAPQPSAIRPRCKSSIEYQDWQQHSWADYVDRMVKVGKDLPTGALWHVSPHLDVARRQRRDLQRLSARPVQEPRHHLARPLRRQLDLLGQHSADGPGAAHRPGQDAVRQHAAPARGSHQLRRPVSAAHGLCPAGARRERHLAVGHASLVRRRPQPGTARGPRNHRPI